MSLSTVYKAKMDEYDSLISECNTKITAIEKTKSEKEELLQKLDGLNLPSKLDGIIQSIDDTASKLTQSSKYMTNIKLMKDRSFDEGKLGQCGSELASQTEGINALKGEIEEKISTIWPEEIKALQAEIDELDAKKGNYLSLRAGAFRDYKNALANEAVVPRGNNAETTSITTNRPAVPANINNRVFSVIE